MSLKDTLSKEIINATKAGDKIRLETIRGLRAILLEKEIEKRPNPITPDDEMGVLISSAKKRKESIEMYEKGGRTELAEKEKSELNIIEEFLPKQLRPDEVEAIINRIVSETGASSQKDFGKVMPFVMKELKGKADGKFISDTVKKLLGG